MNLLKGLQVKFKEPLKKYTTFKIGGPCDYFIEPLDWNDLKIAASILKKHKIPFRIMGAGSNILAADKGVKGAVIRLGTVFFQKVNFKSNYAYIGAGCRLNKFMRMAKQKGLSGYEFLAGIPATIGGALIMDAGQGKTGKSIEDLVEKVTVMDYNGNINILYKKDLKFSYRKSNLSKYIVLEVCLKLYKSSKEQIAKNIRNYLIHKKASQDMAWPSAGCIFRNPRRGSAGRLIDLCGLKGKNYGDAFISDKHANFILNRGSAKARDVLRLMDLIGRKVNKKFNLTLKPEIQIWD